MDRYGFVILAAGSSSRLGKPKQLLLYKNKTLLQHCIDIALEVNLGPVIVVLGANAANIKNRITLRDTQMFINESWEEGMGSTIAYGINGLLKLEPGLNAAVLMVCDQPHINAPLVKQLIETHEQKQKGIVACAYGKTLGTPVLFANRFLHELLALKGQEGAKKIIYRHEEDVERVPFPEGEVDIDTIEDYDRLKPR